MTPKELRECADKLFSKRTQLLTLWQDIACNFYPERADFTVRRELGREFASDLTTSYPILARRDLGNSLGSMLRPTAKEWFHIRTGDVNVNNDVESRRWLEYAERTMRRAMYDKPAQFTRATKEGDHDFAAFGQCAISVELNRHASALLYRCWHLRDLAWQENQDGAIGQIYRKWKPTCQDLMRLFPATVDQKVKEQARKEPFSEVNCLHIVVEAFMVDGNYDGKYPFVSIFYDVDNDKILEQVGKFDAIYVLPRWQTVSGSQYAYSPATVAALPDARLIQAMTLTLLEAGEKATSPPMIAVQEAIRSDVAIYAGGITGVDPAYDERLGEVLRPLTQDMKGMPIGVDMQRDTRAMIHEAFFLNKLAMPQRAAEMTAFEVGQRVQEYVRQALPIFEPMEADYNGAICDATFSLLLRGGAFGSMHNMPPSLQGQEIQFSFMSPLHDAIDSERSHKFLEAQALLAQAAQNDPTAPKVLNFGIALRDALMGIGVPADWQRTPEEVQALDQQAAEAQQAASVLGGMQQAADVAKTVGEASQALGGQGGPVQTRIAA